MQVSRRTWLTATAGSAALAFTGCPTRAPKSPVVTPNGGSQKPLRVWIVALPQLQEKIERFWNAQSDVALDVRLQTVEEARSAKRLTTDVVIYPSALLGTFAAADQLAPLSRGMLDDERFQAGDLLRHARTTEVQWGDQAVAVSLGSPTPLLLYRRDIFAKLQLTPPTTWAEYQAAAEQLAKTEAFQDLLAGAEADWSPVCEPSGAGSTGGIVTFLARAASYARHRNDFGALFDLKTMRSLVSTPPFVRALDDQLAAAKLSSSVPLTVDQTADAISAGRCGMAIGWLMPESKLAANVGIVELPGSVDHYDIRGGAWEPREPAEATSVPLLGAAGVLASVTMAARQPKAAEGFLAWLSAGEESPQIVTSYPRATPFRRSHLAAPQPWLPEEISSDATSEYVAALRQTHDRSVYLLAPRMPGAEEYLAALEAALAQAAAGKPAVESLAAAAMQMDQLTERLGRTEQSRAYQRSLGLDV